MSARSSWSPWLLIEICAWSLVTDASAGCPRVVGSRVGARKDVRVAPPLERSWVGVDIGKAHHWVCALDGDGRTLLSVKVLNDEAEIVALVATVRALAGEAVWAVDIIGAPSALLLALLTQAGQRVRYASGRVVAA